MAITHNAVAVLFPGAQTQDVISASEKYHINIVDQEAYSLQKDYERYFKPSRHIFHKDDVNVLFVFADGTASLIEDGNSMRSMLRDLRDLIGMTFN
ncbi:MAG: hypothetical protein ACTHKV_00305 [Flavipsychrobacter sp.]|jgi:hypothetical protein|nr:hypothetical protein [Bacteroidota bacterium]